MLDAEQEQKLNRLLISTVGSIDKSRDLFQELIKIYNNDKYNTLLMRQLDSVVYLDNLRLQCEIKNKIFDCLVVGTGWGGVAIASSLKNGAFQPLSIISIDKSERRGGVFRDLGINFTLNSPNIGSKAGIIGELEGPNNLGQDVIFQITDFNTENYPTNKLMGDVNAINGYLTNDTLLNCELRDIVKHQDKSYYNLIIENKYNDEIFELRTKSVVLATGQGKSKIDVQIINFDQDNFDKSKVLFSSDRFREILQEESTEGIYNFVKKGIVFIGGRDGTNIIIRYLIQELTRYISLEGLEVKVFGAEYEIAEDFSEVIGNTTYNDLIPYIGKFIKPYKEKIKSVIIKDTKISVEGFNGDKFTNVGKYVVVATGYSDSEIKQIIKKFTLSINSSLVDIYGEDEFQGQIVGQKVQTEKIYLVGLTSRDTSIKNVNKGIRTFARSIRRHLPRVLNVAKVILKDIS